MVSGNGIITTLAERVTAQKATNGKQGATPYAITF
jgi:hypothetical protein